MDLIMAKTFIRDGIEYRRFTMDIPEPLYQLMEATWGRYGKREQITNILIGVLAGIDHYDHELAQLQSRYDQIRATQAALLELRIQEKQATALGIEKVQQLLYLKQQEEAAAAAVTTPGTGLEPGNISEEILEEVSAVLDQEFRPDNYDISAPVSEAWVQHYADLANQHLARRGLQARVDGAWVASHVNQLKRDRIGSVTRFDREIPDKDVPRLAWAVRHIYDASPGERQALEDMYRRVAGFDIGLRVSIDEYLQVRASELAAREKAVV